MLSELTESRKILLPMCMAQLKRHLVVKQETILCSSILGDILVYIHTGTRLQVGDKRGLRVLTDQHFTEASKICTISSGNVYQFMTLIMND